MDDANHLFARADGVAQQLRALVDVTHVASGQSLAAELRWGASGVLADLLLASDTTTPISRDKASEIVEIASSGTVVLPALEERGWIRWVLGRMVIPFGVYRVARASKASQSPLPADETAALEALLASYVPLDEDERTISESKVEAILASRSVDLTTQDLLRAGALQGAGRLVLTLHSSLWRDLGGRIAAIVWERLAAQESTTRFSRWLQTTSPGWWIDACAYLPPVERQRLLDAMVDAIVTDADLKDWAKEIAHLAADQHVPAQAVQPPAPPAATLLARYQWWQRPDLRRVEGVRSREALLTLIAAVVRHDDAGGHSRFARIIRLLESSAEKPALARHVPEQILHARPEALATLAFMRQTASLALVLVDDLNIQETSWDTEAQQGERREQRRADFWRELVPLFVGGLALGPTDPTPLVEVVHHLFEAITDSSEFNPARTTRRARWAHRRLEAMAGALKRARLRHQVNSERPPLLPALTPTLLSSWHAIRRRPRLTRETYSEFSLLFWIVERASEAAPGLEAASAGANEALDRFKSALEDDDYWGDEHRPLFALPWHRALVLQPARIAEFLAPVDFADRIDRIDTIAESRSLDGADILLQRTTWQHQQRCHFGVLLAARRGLANDESLGQSERDKITRRFDDRVRQLLAEDSAGRGAGLFDDSMEIRSGAPALLRDTVAYVEGLDPGTRDATVGAWLEPLQNPAILLGVVAAARVERVRRAAVDRLNAVDSDEALQQMGTIPSLAQLARNAVAAGQPELAERALAHGDNIAHKQLWEDAVFDVRLLLAALRGQREEIDSLQLPSGRENAEASRTFHRGLALLESAPAAAAEIFRGLAEDGPDPGAAGVNLFAARNRLASAIEGLEDRQAAFAAALLEWSGNRERLSGPELERIGTHAAYNTLLALQGSGRYADFERRWQALDDAQRGDESFVRLAFAHFLRQGAFRQAEETIVRAASFHGAMRPEWVAELESDLRRGESSVAPPPAPFVASTLSDDSLRAAFAEARLRPAASRVRIMGASGTTDLAETLLEHHERAAMTLQRLEALLAQLREEDKYSDVMIALLTAQLDHLGITVHSQSRGGLSSATSGRRTSRGGVGERDWALQSGGREVALAEALRVGATDASDTIRAHLEKLVKRYDRTGLQQGFVIVYVEAPDLETVVRQYTAAVSAWSALSAELTEQIRARTSAGAHLRILQSTHSLGSRNIAVFHLLVRVAEALEGP